MAEYGKNPWRVDVCVGDVIDLRDSTVFGNPGRERLRAVVRAEYNKHTIEINAPKESIDLTFGRVTKINRVSHTTKTYNGRSFHYTNCEVELEDAWGSTPTLIAVNSELRAASQDKKGSKPTEWKRPKFTTGDVKDAEKEK